jgi:tetratricopeptide (TPR) repeat protein
VMVLNPDVPAKLASAITKALEKDRERRYPSASEMRADLAEVRTARGTWLRPLSRWLGTAALLVVVAASAWLYQRVRGPITLTNQDTIVLADFTNHTSDPVFGDSLNTALRTEMEQTPFLKLLSSDKVRGTLKQTGRSEGAKLTVEVARDVCLETNSKAVVAGSITDVGNGYRVGLKAVGCQSGKTLATAEAEVANRDEIVRMLGVAGSELRRKLGEPKESLQNFSKPLEEATSASPEALQAYTEGVREEPQRLTAAAPHFKRATELDPNYAMAYAWQAALGSSEVTTKAAANKAYELRARLTDRDRFAVEHVYYRDVTGELEKAVAVYEQWTRTFPLDSVPRIGLAIALSGLGQHERSAAEAREAIRLEPGIDGYCYLMLADIALGRFDDAKTVYEEALAHKFDSLELRLARYRLAFLQNDDAAMQEQVDWAAKTPSAEGPMLWSQLNVEAYHGHVGAAHGYAQRVIDWGHRMGSSGSDPEHKATEAMMDAEAGFLDRAHEEANWALGRASELSARLNVAMALARVGDVPAAQKLVEELNQEYPLDTLTQNYYLPTLRALIALHTNNPGQAIEALRRATPYELAKTDAIDQLYPAYVRGLAYLQSGQGPQAAAEFQKLLDHPGIVAFWLTGPLAYLQLARAQIIMGDQAAARKSYQEFLTLWKDADPDIPIYKQVKAEYAKLQ